MTPEGRVKAAVKAFLHEQGLVRAAMPKHQYPPTPRGWYYMPVQNGMGVVGIHDFIGHVGGRMFSIETKAPGKVPSGVTENQKARGEEMSSTGAMVFFIDDVEELRKQWSAWLGAWLSANKS